MSRGQLGSNNKLDTNKTGILPCDKKSRIAITAISWLAGAGYPRGFRKDFPRKACFRWWRLRPKIRKIHLPSTPVVTHKRCDAILHRSLDEHPKDNHTPQSLPDPQPVLPIEQHHNKERKDGNRETIMAKKHYTQPCKPQTKAIWLFLQPFPAGKYHF